MNGDVSAARELADRTAGKPKQTIEVEQDHSQPQKLSIGGQEIVINA